MFKIIVLVSGSGTNMLQLIKNDIKIEKETTDMTNEKKQELDALCLKFRRTLIEILHEKQTGHPGGSLSVCEILTNLYFNDANISPENINDRSRDKIILCK